MKFENWSLEREDKRETLWTYDRNYSNGNTVAVIVTPWGEGTDDYLVDAVVYDPEREKTVPGDHGQFRKDIGTGQASSWTEAKEMARSWMKRNSKDATSQIEYDPKLYGIVQYIIHQAESKHEAKDDAEIAFKEDLQSSGIGSQEAEILTVLTEEEAGGNHWIVEFEVEVENPETGIRLEDVFTSAANIE
jgi:hypothetical protein